VVRKFALAALAVAAIVATANAPSDAAAARSVSTALQVSATVPALCQDFKRTDGSHAVVCNNVHPIVAPAGATAVGSPYAAEADGRAPLVEYGSSGSQATIIYF
jgi:hypothetical protein